MAEDVRTIDDDLKIKEYSERLASLRKDGVTKESECRIQIAALKKNKLLDDGIRESEIEKQKELLSQAHEVALKNKEEIAALSKEAVKYINTVAKDIEKKTTERQNSRISGAKSYYNKEVEEIKAEAAKKKEAVLSSGLEQKELKEEIAVCDYELKSALYDAKSRLVFQIDQCKAAKNQAFVDHIQKNREMRNGKSVFSEDIKLKYVNYINNFKTSKFFLSNGLYIVIILFFIACIILAPLRGRGNLLNLPNIFTILEQSSTRMFYALGVAGLILLAGTDLSVGRMVALGSVTTGLILHPGRNIVTFMGMGPWDFSPIPMPVRLIMALFLSILFCTCFACFSGFFNAKLRMHPFISTMATQLIIYGILFYGTTGVPVGTIDRSIKDAIGGRWTLGYFHGQLITFPKLIVPALVAITVVWIIWNKTTFGKNMYAVGGNGEAAAVSGISVFWITMGVFALAGICYGCGSFLEAFRANASAGTGQGYETDAIAACVVGGISFSGGIGRIGGAVLGVIIFTSLTYCLTFLGIDTNLQFVFKGIIILVAVSLDSIKYLKKK